MKGLLAAVESGLLVNSPFLLSAITTRSSISSAVALPPPRPEIESVTASPAEKIRRPQTVQRVILAERPAALLSQKLEDVANTRRLDRPNTSRLQVGFYSLATDYMLAQRRLFRSLGLSKDLVLSTVLI